MIRIKFSTFFAIFLLSLNQLILGTLGQAKNVQPISTTPIITNFSTTTTSVPLIINSTTPITTPYPVTNGTTPKFTNSTTLSTTTTLPTTTTPGTPTPTTSSPIIPKYPSNIGKWSVSSNYYSLPGGQRCILLKAAIEITYNHKYSANNSQLFTIDVPATANSRDLSSCPNPGQIGKSTLSLQWQAEEMDKKDVRLSFNFVSFQTADGKGRYAIDSILANIGNGELNFESTSGMKFVTPWLKSHKCGSEVKFVLDPVQVDSSDEFLIVKIQNLQMEHSMYWPEHRVPEFSEAFYCSGLSVDYFGIVFVRVMLLGLFLVILSICLFQVHRRRTG